MLLPRRTTWQRHLPARLSRAIVLSVAAEALSRPLRSGCRNSGRPASLGPGGFGDVFARLEPPRGPRSLDRRRNGRRSRKPRRTAADAAHQRLGARCRNQQDGDPGRDPAPHLPDHRAQARRSRPCTVACRPGGGHLGAVLAKAVRRRGNNFTPLCARAPAAAGWADLSNPTEAHRSISEIAYRYGYSDSAHFSRTFRHRFGSSPREFRQQRSSSAHQRLRPFQDNADGPQDALAPRAPAAGNLKRDVNAAVADAVRHHGRIRAITIFPSRPSACIGDISTARCHPVLEISSGDTVTVETLTQHASDDPELMIVGDAGAESVFGWTAHRKNVDRRGAGPMDASVSAAAPAKGSGSTSAPARSQ